LFDLDFRALFILRVFMKARILLAEVNTDAAEVVAGVLRFLGHEVTVARDGVEAVESAMSLRPDLSVMDMMMPRMDGFQAVLELRHHPETQTIPILAAIALVGSEDRKRCLASGCDDYLPKPLTTKDLVINRLLCFSPNEELTVQSLKGVAKYSSFSFFQTGYRIVT
jgi:CheY-like chemotaxis protein